MTSFGWPTRPIRIASPRQSPEDRNSIRKSRLPILVLNLFDILGPTARAPEITAAVSVLAGNDEIDTRGALPPSDPRQAVVPAR